MRTTLTEFPADRTPMVFIIGIRIWLSAARVRIESAAEGRDGEA